MFRVICVLAVVAGLTFGVLVLAGCDSAADRAAAEADRVQAAALAYQVRVAADTSAAVERAAIREAERQAGHERVLELLPFVALILGAVGLAGLGLLVWSGRRPAQQVVDPGLLLLVDEQRRQLAAAERAAWRLVANEQRRQLGAERQVTIYDERR